MEIVKHKYKVLLVVLLTIPRAYTLQLNNAGGIKLSFSLFLS